MQWGPPSAPPRNGLGTAALICGIVGAVLGLIPLLFVLSLGLGVTALILGLVGRGDRRVARTSGSRAARAGRRAGPAWRRGRDRRGHPGPGGRDPR